MIIDAWGIKTIRNKDIGKKQLYCFLADKEEIFYKRKKGYKVRYLCDEKDCKYPNKIHMTTSAILLKKGNWNNYKKQMCRSCRSRKSEKNKGVTISFDEIKRKLKSEGYIIITKKDEYENTPQPSQFKIQVICERGHKHHITWNNWSKGKRCRECYNEKREENSITHLIEWDLYRFYVLKHTQNSFKKYEKSIDPKNIRGRKWHLDHKYSISQGFRNNILPNIIGHHTNLELISMYDNTSKGEKCSITKKELFNGYFKENKFI